VTGTAHRIAVGAGGSIPPAMNSASLGSVRLICGMRMINSPANSASM